MAARRTARIRSRNRIAVANPIKSSLINKFNKQKLGLKKNQGEEKTSGKKKSGGNGSNTMTRNSFFPRDVISVDDNVVCEILSRLPAKSLMRFKCVSKHWYDLIRKDPYLIDLHLSRSKARPKLLITVSHTKTMKVKRPANQTRRTGTLVPCAELFLATADILFQGREVSAVAAVDTTKEEYMDLHDVSKPLNGLICLYNRQNNSIRVCNINTRREVTPWIKSSFRKGDINIQRHCDLGFDPVTKEHKVICIYRQACEVLTVGDGKWRKIPACDDFTYRGRGASVYVNGSIYYSPEILKYVMGYPPEFIAAFDVGKEKFRAIEIPNFILDQNPEENYTFNYVQLLEIDGHPALLKRTSGYITKMWFFDDDYNNGYKSNTWKEVTIQLPLYWGIGDYAHSVCLNSVIGTDLIIICSYCIFGRNQTTHIRLHSYNWKNNNFTEIKVDPSLIPQGERALRVSVSTFGESLLPVRM